MQCNFFDLNLKNHTVSSAFKQPEGVNFKFLELLRKPINIDITLYSEHHNGLECVNIVKQYLQENELIEPLILVVKHMLKVWGYNNPYTGGLGSYAMFLMIVSFL